MMRRAQYWAVLGFSLSITTTTSLDESSGQRGALNAALVALMLLGVAGLELVHLHRSMDIAQISCGLWLAISPFVLGYIGTGQMGYCHIVLGLLLMLFGMFHLRRDWSLPGKKKREHGK